MKKCCEWFNWKVLLAAFIYAVVAQIIHTIGAMASMKYYLMPEYFPVWSKIMMPVAGPPPLSFTIYSLIYALITGLLFAVVYNIIKGSIKQKSVVKKGLCFGLILFVVAIPTSLMLHLLINLPLALIVFWSIESLILYLIIGIIFAKMLK